jgi:hypothetical protein
MALRSGIFSRQSFLGHSFLRRRMQSSGTLRCVDLGRTNVSEERIVSIIRVTKLGELETTLAVTS